jgi:hypothetical protein
MYGADEMLPLFEVVVVGWIAEAAVKWAVGWLIGAILKVKFGG